MSPSFVIIIIIIIIFTLGSIGPGVKTKKRTKSRCGMAGGPDGHITICSLHIQENWESTDTGLAYHTAFHVMCHFGIMNSTCQSCQSVPVLVLFFADMNRCLQVCIDKYHFIWYLH